MSHVTFRALDLIHDRRTGIGLPVARDTWKVGKNGAKRVE